VEERVRHVLLLHFYRRPGKGMVLLHSLRGAGFMSKGAGEYIEVIYIGLPIL
jgi:hypothetical protein